MVKRFFALIMFLLVMASSACAEVELWHAHDSFAGITNGHSDFSDARFGALYFSVIHNDVPVTKENANLIGSITLSGGNYSFWNGREIQKVSGTHQTFKLGLETWSESGDQAAYQPFTDAGGELKCGIEAENGLNGVTASWNFPNDPSMNGQSTFPNYKTTQEQMNSFVLYFEFIRSGSDVTGINWRIVRASDTSTPVVQNFDMRIQTFEVWNYDESKIYNGRPRIVIEAGETPEGTFDFGESIREADIYRVRTRLYAYDESAEKIYTWNFYTAVQPEMYLWNYHASDARLVNGRSSYNNAEFANVFFCLENDTPAVTEVKYFTDAGRITVPGGGYTLKNAETGAALSTVASDTAFKLRFDREGGIYDEYLEYWPVDDNGRLLAFAGGAETGLNGKTISWTFPAELNLNGSGVIPNYKSTAEQLRTGVPYIELVTENGYITAVNYKIVTSSDTSTAITPSYRTDFRFYFDRTENQADTWANAYRPSWIRNTASGTCTLSLPQPVSMVKRIRVRLRSYEDSSSPAVYQWNFYPAANDPIPTPTPATPSSSSGGCNAGFTLIALALGAMFIKKH